MPKLGMCPTTKKLPVSGHCLVLGRKYATFGTANRFQRVDRFGFSQSGRRARTALVYRITNNAEYNDNPEQ